MRVIAWLVCLIVAILGYIVGISPSALATAANAWGSGSRLISRGDWYEPYDTLPCNGNRLSIHVAGNGVFSNACVQGEVSGMRLARFYSGMAYLYAVSFPRSSEFYEARGVCIFDRCAYSSDSDTYIGGQPISPTRIGAVVYRNFSNHLVKQFDPLKAATYFQFNPPGADYELNADGLHPAAGAMNISRNGKWALIELRDYGIFRLNLQTFHTSRILLPGTYGIGNDPVFEMAISDDGTVAVVTGKYGGFQAISIDEYCGDRFTAGIWQNYSYSVIPCQTLAVSPELSEPQAEHIGAPRFSSADNHIGITAHYNSGRAERIILGAASSQTAQSVSYLALGDSFSSGEGETEAGHYYAPSDEPPLRCHVSNRSYPYLVASLWGISAKNVACSGAQTVDILGAQLGSQSYAGQANALLNIGSTRRAQLEESSLDMFRSGVVPQVNFVATYQPTVVSIGIGGNDAGLIAKAKTCLTPGTCEWVTDLSKRYATAQEILNVYPKVVESIQRVQQLSPASKVFVVGYPHIINTAEDARCGALLGAILSTEERRFVAESIHYVNQILHAAAVETGVNFADIEDSYAGHELCGEIDDSAMNAIRFGDDIAPVDFLPGLRIFASESFHPTPKGHQLVAEEIARQLPSPSVIQKCIAICPPGSSPQSPVVLLEAPDYWKSTNLPATYTRQLYEETILPEVVYNEATIQLNMKQFSLKPNETVSIQVDDKDLIKEVSITDDGLLQQVLTLPDDISPGYHTLHITGTTLLDQPIDIYDTFARQPLEISSTNGPQGDYYEGPSQGIPTARSHNVGALSMSPVSTNLLAAIPNRENSVQNTPAGQVLGDMHVANLPTPWAVILTGLALAVIGAIIWYRHHKAHTTSYKPRRKKV